MPRQSKQPAAKPDDPWADGPGPDACPSCHTQTIGARFAGDTRTMCANVECGNWSRGMGK